MNEVILDTGPLVAYLDRREEHHRWAVEQFSTLTDPLLVCEAVITEACFLLKDFTPAIVKVGEYLERGVLEMASVGSAAQWRVFALMGRYRNLPMSYADACVTWLAESRPRARVFTLDSHFSVYRLEDRRPVPLIAPF